MAISGMGHMLKALGIDPEEITASVTTFMETVKTSIAEVRANQQAITDQNTATQFLLKEVIAGQVEVLTILRQMALRGSEDFVHAGEGKFDPEDVQAAVSVFDVKPQAVITDGKPEVAEWPTK